MRKNEIKSISIYLKNIIEGEEKGIISKYKLFYEKNKIVPKEKLFIYLGEEEYFFILLKDKGYGIYFNDIEEGFGVCKLDNDPITIYAEFSNDSLNGAIVRFNELLKDGTINDVLKGHR